jgi:hypothetical protein
LLDAILMIDGLSRSKSATFQEPTHNLERQTSVLARRGNRNIRFNDAWRPNDTNR